MSAAVATDLRGDPGYLRGLLAEAQETLVEQAACMDYLVFVIHLVNALDRSLEVPDQVVAERRILGALLAGHAGLADVADLRAGHFDGAGHRELFALITTTLEVLEERQQLAELGGPRRHQVAGFVRRLLAPGDKGRPARMALRRLPWPGSCPRDAIALVGALGRWRRGT
jgi:hypothetical protein